MPQINAPQSFDDDASLDPVAAPAAQAAVQATTDAIDDLLDQIDGTLQVNAEQFVRSFVQKGGE